jgi:Kdo2-lipid IVA lauroyltransferase/acyltransferase
MRSVYFYMLYYLIRFIGLLPLKVLYLLSDMLYYIFYYIIRYRKDVIIRNLTCSFPERDRDEIKEIAKRYYRHLCDLIIEAIYQPGMGENEIKRRVRYNNMDLIKMYYNQGRDVAVITGHYNNWEWICGFPLFTRYKCLTIYRQLKNKVVDRLMLKTRSRFGAELVPMKLVIRRLYNYRESGDPTITLFIADQTPPMEKVIGWFDFLNQETPVYLGPERIAKKMNMAVVYLKMKKIRRGYYEYDIVPLFENSSETADNEITRTHLAILGSQIREQPEFWLWSHRRWKLKRELINSSL